MKATRVDARYAKSLLGLAVERNELEQVFADIQVIKTTCEGSKDLQMLLQSPVIKADKKKSILDAIFADKLGKTVSMFVDILTAKGRESNIEGIAESFEFQYKAHLNIKTAKVTSAIKLDEATKAKVLDIVKAKEDVVVDLVEEVDGDIIGGFVLRMGDNQIDASVKNKLYRLEKNFSKNPYVADI